MMKRSFVVLWLVAVSGLYADVESEIRLYERGVARPRYRARIIISEQAVRIDPLQAPEGESVPVLLYKHPGQLYTVDHRTRTYAQVPDGAAVSDSLRQLRDVFDVRAAPAGLAGVDKTDERRRIRDMTALKFNLTYRDGVRQQLWLTTAEGAGCPEAMLLTLRQMLRRAHAFQGLADLMPGGHPMITIPLDGLIRLSGYPVELNHRSADGADYRIENTGCKPFQSTADTFSIPESYRRTTLVPGL